MVVLNRTRQSTTPPLMYYSKGVWVSHRRSQDDENVKSARIDLAQRPVDKDENVNGRRGTLKNVEKEVNSKMNQDAQAHSSQFNYRGRVVSYLFEFEFERERGERVCERENKICCVTQAHSG